LAEGVAKLGRLDIVVANAGIVSYGFAGALTEAQWVTMVDINLSGAWRTCKAAIPHLVAGERGGSIVITSSGAGLKGYANGAHYVAAKHGLVGLMRTLALELAPVRVNLIAPGFVDTSLSASLLGGQLDARREQLRTTLPIGRVVGPADVAALAVHLMTNTAVTGATYDIDGGQQLLDG